MKLAGIITVTVLGFHRNPHWLRQRSKPPSRRPKKTPKAEEEIDSDFVLPADYGAPGTMEMSWEPTAPPPEKEGRRPRKQDAKPHFVSTKKRSLFSLPVKQGHD